MSELPWFRDEDTLLDELRRQVTSSPVPQLPGYAELVPVARGGQGIVFRAIQRATNRPAAIKVLADAPTNVVARRARFEREIELAASLEHPHVVRIYEGGTLADGRLFAAMEFVDGVPIDEFASTHSLTTDAVVDLFIGVCDAVSHAHQRGVIHRDLKPSNILVSADGAPHVLDFGIAMAVDRAGYDTTRTGDFVGTLAYASPEQISADPLTIDTRSDVYALGVVLFRLLTGKSPYAVEGPLADVIESIRSRAPGRPSQLGTLADRELDAVVARALAKAPDERYSSVDALAADLRRYQAGEALEAKRDRAWYVLRKTLRHYRVALASVAGAATLLIAFSIVVTTLWQRAVAEERKTREIKVFWEDTLGSVTAGQPGDPITFREVLDEALHWVAITTKGQPEIEASLRTTIGNGYRNLGMYGKADQQLQRSLDLRRRLYGTDHADVIQSINAVALLRESEGRYAEAETSFREALEARELLLGSTSPEVAMSLQNLGRLAMQLGNFSEAADYFDRSLQIRRQHYTADDPAIATVLFDQGELWGLQEQWDQAVDQHQAALTIRQARLPRTHPDVARSLVSLGRAQLAAGRQSQALSSAQAALDIRKSVLDPSHVLVQEATELVRQSQP